MYAAWTPAAGAVNPQQVQMMQQQQQLYWQQYYQQVGTQQAAVGVVGQAAVSVGINPAPPVNPPPPSGGTEKPPLPPEPPPDEKAKPAPLPQNEAEKKQMSALQQQAAQWQEQQKQWQQYQQNWMSYQQQAQQYGSQQQPQQSTPQAAPAPSPSQAANTTQQSNPSLKAVLEEERQFEKQYSDWLKQYEDWKHQNQNHPDKKQYAEYEKQWQTYREQMESRRRVILNRKQEAMQQVANYGGGGGESYGSQQGQGQRGRGGYSNYSNQRGRGGPKGSQGANNAGDKGYDQQGYGHDRERGRGRGGRGGDRDRGRGGGDRGRGRGRGQKGGHQGQHGFSGNQDDQYGDPFGLSGNYQGGSGQYSNRGRGDTDNRDRGRGGSIRGFGRGRGRGQASFELEKEDYGDEDYRVFPQFPRKAGDNNPSADNSGYGRGQRDQDRGGPMLPGNRGRGRGMSDDRGRGRGGRGGHSAPVALMDLHFDSMNTSQQRFDPGDVSKKDESAPSADINMAKDESSKSEKASQSDDQTDKSQSGPQKGDPKAEPNAGQQPPPNKESRYLGPGGFRPRGPAPPNPRASHVSGVPRAAGPAGARFPGPAGPRMGGPPSGPPPPAKEADKPDAVSKEEDDGTPLLTEREHNIIKKAAEELKLLRNRVKPTEDEPKSLVPYEDEGKNKDSSEKPVEPQYGYDEFEDYEPIDNEPPGPDSGPVTSSVPDPGLPQDAVPGAGRGRGNAPHSSPLGRGRGQAPGMAPGMGQSPGMGHRGALGAPRGIGQMGERGRGRARGMRGMPMPPHGGMPPMRGRGRGRGEDIPDYEYAYGEDQFDCEHPDQYDEAWAPEMPLMRGRGRGMPPVPRSRGWARGRGIPMDVDREGMYHMDEDPYYMREGEGLGRARGRGVLSDPYERRDRRDQFADSYPDPYDRRLPPPYADRGRRDPFEYERDPYGPAAGREPLPPPGREHFRDPYARAPYRDPLRDPLADPALRDSLRDPLRDPLRAPLRDPLRDPYRDPLRDPLRDPIRDPLRDPVRDPLLDPVREPYRDAYVPTSGYDPYSAYRATPPSGPPKPAEVIDYGHGAGSKDEKEFDMRRRSPDRPLPRAYDDRYGRRRSRSRSRSRERSLRSSRSRSRSREREFRRADRGRFRSPDRRLDRDRDYRRDRDPDLFARLREEAKHSPSSQGSPVPPSNYRPLAAAPRYNPPPAMEKAESVLVETILSSPGRKTRPERIVVIIRGLPGSGKTYISKLIRDKEVANGGTAPRMLCLDDYFMVENEKKEKDPDTGKVVNKFVLEYEFDAEMEETYKMNFLKSFKRQIDEAYFSFIIVDAVFEKAKNVEEFWSYAMSKGFQVYVVETQVEVNVCAKRNLHNRSLKEIRQIQETWQITPRHYTLLDVRALLQDAAIEDVEMEDAPDDVPEDKKSTEEDEEEEAIDVGYMKSKWEIDTSGEKLDKLDGIVMKKKQSSPQRLEDFLQLPDDYDTRRSQPGKKRVRWADIEERKQQMRMREIGFVIGHTDWNKMTDDSYADRALNRTKYI